MPRYCRECDVWFACHGGCPKDRFLDTPDGEPGLNYLCAGFQAFFRHIDWSMRHMSAQLRKGRAPADIMAVYSRDDAKRARNGPCTCGGGRMEAAGTASSVRSEIIWEATRERD